MRMGRGLGSPWLQFEGMTPMAVILVVDDESFVRGIVEEILALEGVLRQNQIGRQYALAESVLFHFLAQ
jgi:CheY-like chemotaxis protein